MMRRILRSCLVVVMILILGASAPAVRAASPLDGKIVGGGEVYMLLPGDVLDGDLTVMGVARIGTYAWVKGNVFLLGGVLHVANESVIEGDVLVVGGSVSIDGTVEGDLRVMGGVVELGPHAIVMGKMYRLGGRLVHTPAFSSGCPDELFPLRPPTSNVHPRQPRWHMIELTAEAPLGRVLWQMARVVLQAFALAALAAVVFLFSDEPARHMVEKLKQTPGGAGGVGVAAMVLLPLVAAGMALTVLLFPLALMLLVAAAVFGLYGWLMLGLMFGEKMTDAMHFSHLSAPLQGAMGTFVLTLIVGWFALVPWLGWIPAFLAVAFGFGAGLLVAWDMWQERTSQQSGGSGDEEGTPVGNTVSSA